jgi:hypothetical protein
MINNISESTVAQRVARCRAEIPSSGPFLDRAAAHPDGFDVRLEAPGFELAAQHPVEGRPNRAIIKIFSVPDGPMKGQAAVFFFKRSQIPFSLDRFSYGVCLLPAVSPPDSDLDGWLAFASSGFDPGAVPGRLRRAFTFTIPD